MKVGKKKRRCGLWHQVKNILIFSPLRFLKASPHTSFPLLVSGLLENGVEKILKYGIACYMKHCKVMCSER